MIRNLDKKEGIKHVETPKVLNKPISEKKSKPNSHAINFEMITLLTHRFVQYENKEQVEHKERIFNLLNKTVQGWMKEVLMEKGISEFMGGGLYKFGSHELGTASPNGDIDLLIVAPS